MIGDIHDEKQGPQNCALKHLKTDNFFSSIDTRVMLELFNLVDSIMIEWVE